MCFSSRAFPERGVKLFTCAGRETDSSTCAPLPAPRCQHAGCMSTPHTVWERHTLPKNTYIHTHNEVNTMKHCKLYSDHYFQHPPKIFFIFGTVYLYNAEPVQLSVVVVQCWSRTTLPRTAVLLCCSQLWTGDHSHTFLTANLYRCIIISEELLLIFKISYFSIRVLFPLEFLG